MLNANLVEYVWKTDCICVVSCAFVFFSLRDAVVGSGGCKCFGLTCLALTVSFISVLDSCVKTIGGHDSRVFDVNERVDNSLEPRGQYGLTNVSFQPFCFYCVRLHVRVSLCAHVSLRYVGA